MVSLFPLLSLLLPSLSAQINPEPTDPLILTDPLTHTATLPLTSALHFRVRPGLINSVPNLFLGLHHSRGLHLHILMPITLLSRDLTILAQNPSVRSV